MIRPSTTRLFRRLRGGALGALWVASAVGHGGLMVSRWESLSLSQLLMLLVAVVASLGLLWATRWISGRPSRLLVVLLLVGLAHTPGEVLANPATPWMAAAVVAFALAVSGEAPARRTEPMRRVAFAGLGPSPEPATRWLAFDLLCRPPPAR